MKKIYLFGDGGHVLSCIDVIKKQKKFKKKGIFSKKPGLKRKIQIIECNPISKKKKWKVLEK